MDRNIRAAIIDRLEKVALREGGVDRNFVPRWHRVFLRVALREGGVDRNAPTPTVSLAELGSPSARGAWIATG